MFSSFDSRYNLNKEFIKMVIMSLGDQQVKAEISRQIRVEMDNEKNKNIGSTYSQPFQTYNSLTSGNVNLQARMAASGYSVYGETTIDGNKPLTNKNAYQRMKNKIKYGRKGQNGFNNISEQAKF